MCVNIQYLFFWFTSLCVTGSRFIHLTRTDSNPFSLWLSDSPLYIQTTSSSICPTADGHPGCFHVLAIVDRATVNTGVHVSFRVVAFSGYMPSNGIAESYGRFIPSFLRNLHTVLHNGCISLHSCQQCRVIPFSQHSPAFVCRFLDDGHSDWCELIPHCTFHLNFSNN